MSTLLFPLSGPMQAWGVSSNFSIRDTLHEPSKSGVMGLLCAALGLSRQADLTALAALRFGVRVDREGKIMVDFHTAKDAMNAGGSKLKNAVISNRYYLADAVFLVGLEGEKRILEKIYQALQKPVWFLFLGRKSFPLAEPPWFPLDIQPIQDTSLEEALLKFAWLGYRPRFSEERKVLQELPYYQLIQTPEKLPYGSNNKLRLALEEPIMSTSTSENGLSKQNKTIHQVHTLLDQPVSFHQRTFSRRKVQRTLIPIPSLSLIKKGD